MNVTAEQLSRVERVDSTPERAPKFGLDRPYDGDFIFNGTKVRFMATTPGGIEELRLVYQEYEIFTYPTCQCVSLCPREKETTEAYK